MDSMIKNVVIYCRVAHTDDFALKNQKAKLMEYALGQGYNVKAIVTETASGIAAERSGLKELLAMVAAGDMDAVLVNNVSRIHRDVATLYKIIDFLKTNDVELLSINGTIDGMDELKRAFVKRAMSVTHVKR